MILVDDREGSRDLSALIAQRGIDTELCRLDSADLAWLGYGPGGEVCQIGAEVKKIRDLLHSIRTGRLAGHQVPLMIEQYKYRYLIVNGAVRPNPDTGILEEPRRGGWKEVLLGQQRFLAEDVDKFLCTLETQAGFRIRRCGSLRELLDTVCALYRWWSKPWEEHSSLKVIYSQEPPCPAVTRYSLLRRVAVQLPGVGWEKSAEVERSFHSVYDMATADRKRWSGIRGIGKVLSRRIYDSIRGQE